MKESVKPQEEYLNIYIRRANENDIEEVIEICRQCFPHSLKHNTFRLFAKIRWRRLILEPGVELYVALCNSQIAAFYLLISDLKKYNLHQKTNLHKKLLDYLASIGGIIRKPGILLKSFKAKLKKRLLMANNSSGNNHNFEPNIEIEKLAWAELRATSPRFQRMQIARKLSNYIYDHCRRIEKQYLGSIIDVNNVASLSLKKSDRQCNYQSNNKSYIKFITKL